MLAGEKTFAIASWFLGMVASQIRYMWKLLRDVTGVIVVDKKKLNEVEVVWRLFSELLNMEWVIGS